jgi:hypothetical protein
MTRKEIFEAIEKERAYQEEKWGVDFDDKNTPNDWVVYLCMYATDAAKMSGGPKKTFDVEKYKKNLLKTASLAVAALEALDRLETPPKRHYDA